MAKEHDKQAEIPGRIIGIHAPDVDTVALLISKRADEPVGPGKQAGYVVGLGVPFEITSVSDDQEIVRAIVRGPLGWFEDEHGDTGRYDRVVMYPTLPTLDRDVQARVVGIEAEGEQTRIVIGFGMAHGAQVGMRGRLVYENGREHPRGEFCIDRAGVLSVSAAVALGADEIRQCPHVLLVMS